MVASAVVVVIVMAVVMIVVVMSGIFVFVAACFNQSSLCQANSEYCDGCEKNVFHRSESLFLF